MSKDKLEVLEDARPNRRTLLKGLLVGLGAGVLVQAAGGVTAFAGDTPIEPQKTERRGNESIKLEKAKVEKSKIEKSKVEKTKGSSSKNEKRKAEEPKQQ